jgi:hypothetical protein
MKYDKEQFIWEVINEAIALRTHATQQERNKLCIQLLNPRSQTNCIFGLMTGDCDSTRALELIQKCASRYVVDCNFTAIKFDGFNRIKEHINGRYVENLSEKRHNRFSNADAYYATIEAYILLPKAKNENLIAYLRGDIEELDIYL